jgi:hypothetical protein
MPLPKSFTDPEALSEKIEEYFERCESSKKVYELKNGDIKIRQEFPTMSGLAVFLGVTRDTLYSYMNGESKTGNSEEVSKSISDTLSYARQRVATYLSQCSLAGDADAKIASMLLTAMGETTPESSTTVNVIIQGDSDAYSV